MDLGGGSRIHALPWNKPPIWPDRADPMMHSAELKCELKKIVKQLKHLIDLKQQANMMAGAFYGCVIAMGLFYLMFINR